MSIITNSISDPNTWASFYKHGYIHLKQVLSNQIISKINKSIEKCEENVLKTNPISEFTEIFSHFQQAKRSKSTVGTMEQIIDHYRLQAEINIKKSPFNVLHKEIQNLVVQKSKQWKMNWTLVDWVVLQSRPGGPEQMPHTDFISQEIFETTSLGRMQASILVGLMDSKIILYPGNFIYYNDCDRFELQFKKGDLVLFRGDLVHSGASYDEINYRLHAYLTDLKIEHFQNLTQPAILKTYICEFCFEFTGSHHNLVLHFIDCKGIVKLEEIKKQKEDLKQDSKHNICCDFENCDYIGKSLNNLRVHKTKKHRKKHKYEKNKIKSGAKR
eukprot:NODE_717_length_4502_cov_0.079718.p3 type:complete len:328 gc:universal NODE_717_length_4502_cov_0.079718:3455-4438(+)